MNLQFKEASICSNWPQACADDAFNYSGLRYSRTGYYYLIIQDPITYA